MDGQNKLWVLSEVFYPEQVATAYIMTEIVEAIAGSREVNVICGPVLYEKRSSKSMDKTFSPNIHIHRINSVNLDKNKLVFRTIKMLFLTFSMSFSLLRRSRKGDDVFIVTNPAFLLLVTGYIARLKKLKLYILVHDVFPENVVAAGVFKSRSIMVRLLKKLFNRGYNKADLLIVLGRDMKEVIEKKISMFNKKSKIEIIENWADVINIKPSDKKDNAIVKELDLAEKIVFQFAGNLGRVQGLQDLFSVIKEINNPLLFFIIMGEGAIKGELEELIKINKLRNIKILPSISRNEQHEFLNASDVGIVSLTDNMLGLGVPSKSYNIMAAGKPILFIGNLNSEIALTVNQYGNGWVFENNDRNRLIDFFNSITPDSVNDFKDKGYKSRKLAENKFSKTDILNKFKEVLLKRNHLN